MRYEVHLIKGTDEVRVQLEMDIDLKQGDVFPHGPDIYKVGSVQRGHDGADAIIFATVEEDEVAQAEG
jgi:hypothetical protein